MFFEIKKQGEKEEGEGEEEEEGDGRLQMKFTHPLPVEGPAFIILSLGGLHYVDLR